MDLGIEVGNTLVKFGLFQKRFLKKIYSFPTKEIKSKIHIPEPLLKLKLGKIVIASVVPEINEKLSKVLKKIYEVKPFIIGVQDCKIPLRIKEPKKVGIDRVLNCKSAYYFYGGPSVIVDIGTAITIDIVSQKGIFLGGIIIPGPELWLNSLTNTSLLPKINFCENVKIVGKNTEEAISSGVKYGITFLIEGIVKKLKNKYPDLKTILTGGGSFVFKKFLKIKFIHHPYLSLEGIGVIINNGN